MRIVIAEAGVEYRIACEYRIKTPADAHREVQEIVGGDTECFVVLCLDAKNGMRSSNIVTTGLLDASLVHPREVFRPAVLANCAALVLAHNHPTGDLTPSAEDIRTTKQLVEAGKILDIKVLDHVIIGPALVGQPQWYSMREQGLVAF